MSNDATEHQGGPQRRRSQEISLNRQRPPAEVPGYEAERCLGVGAFGEVWVAVEHNTGRRVAIKFYTHSGGLDWPLLSREVEKLSFLFSDRYIVQLLSVGWNSEPPYYIMEYIERGSLAERLRQGPLAVDEAVEIFRGVAIGLVHAHDKGVLHCDLKPANILLDQDGHPRLADFGQSRLSHEQVPSLGTLFYMAPEQARLSETPDARWDVYALGAVLYCMLAGRPPHRSASLVEKLEQTSELQKRLNLYCRAIRKSPAPSAHRQVAGVDRELQEIVDRCLAAKPENRFRNVQEVLSALDARRARHARRPMMLLGAIGPVLLMLVVFAFAFWGFNAALNHSKSQLTKRALQANEFAAQYVAQAVGDELKARYHAAEILARKKPLQKALAEATDKGSPLRPLLSVLGNPKLEDAPEGHDRFEAVRQEFCAAPARQKLQEVFTRLITGSDRMPDAVGWFLNGADGVQVARWPEKKPSGEYYPTVGRYYGWRSYFHGGPVDEPKNWLPSPQQHITDTHLSAVYQSQGTGRWVIAVSAPIYSDGESKGRRFLGVVSLLIEVGRFVDFFGTENQLAVLVDCREGRHKGLILQHPRFDEILDERQDAVLKLTKLRADAETISELSRQLEYYHDPLDHQQNDGKMRWLAYIEPVCVRGRPTGLAVIVQEGYAAGIGDTISKLAASMFFYGLIALCVIVLLMMALWFFAIRLSGPSAATRSADASESVIDLSPGDSDSAATPGLSGESPTEPIRRP